MLIRTKPCKKTQVDVHYIGLVANDKNVYFSIINSGSLGNRIDPKFFSEMYPTTCYKMANSVFLRDRETKWPPQGMCFGIPPATGTRDCWNPPFCFCLTSTHGSVEYTYQRIFRYLEPFPRYSDVSF